MASDETLHCSFCGSGLHIQQYPIPVEECVRVTLGCAKCGLKISRKLSALLLHSSYAPEHIMTREILEVIADDLYRYGLEKLQEEVEEEPEAEEPKVFAYCWVPPVEKRMELAREYGLTLTSGTNKSTSRKYG